MKTSIIRIASGDATFENGVDINIASYRYLSIFCDEFINPLANDLLLITVPAGFQLYDRLYFETPDRRRFKINGELYNYPILNVYDPSRCGAPVEKPEYSHIRLYHRRNPNQVTHTYENFNGNLYIILSDYPLDYRIAKRLPSAHVYDTVLANGTNVYYLGIRVDDVNNGVLINYIPELLRYFKILYKLEAGIEVRFYAVDVDYTPTRIDLIGSPLVGQGTYNLELGAPTIRIEVHNADQQTARSFLLNIAGFDYMIR